MNRSRIIRATLPLVIVALAALPQSVLACATCFGASDDGLAKGMNMGILSLLAVVVVVLGGIAVFFIYLAKRAAILAARAADTSSLEQSESL